MDRKQIRLRQYITLILTIILSSALFMALYRFNNKYTHKSNQAINGVLYVSEGDWATTPIRYLRDGWKYYTDRLLTPETLKLQGDTYQYLSIGEESNLAMGDLRRSPHGSASYAMTLYLPDEEHSYTIELPEIYSSYRFYVDNKLRLQMGTPDPEAYQDRMGCRATSFEASGKVTLLLAVTDQSWIYSGLVYAPAFGEPLSVNSSRAIRMFLSLIVGTVSIMLAILAFFLVIRTRNRIKNIWVFFLLCLATTVFSSYSVVHGIIPLPIQPWYSIELVSGYLVTLFVIILHNSTCDTKRIMWLISVSISGVVCVIALLYGINAASLTQPVMIFYSRLVFGFKVLTAAYLLFTSAIAVRRKIEKATVLFYADIFYACAFVWDRILPNYEPRIGGWFQEWGSLSLVLGAGMLLWYDVFMGYLRSFVYSQEQRQMKRQLTMQVEHLRQMNQKVDESNKLRHDFRHHLRTLITLSEEGRKEELENYIRGITEINEGTRLGRLTDNIELDALVHYYNGLAQSCGIKFRARLQLPAELNFPIVDLCGLIGNLLENAVEACQRQKTGDKTIFIAGRLQDHQLEFVVDNSFDGQLKIIEDKYVSAKRNDFGLGISSIVEVVERNRGVINLYADSNGFHAEVSLPLRPIHSIVSNT